MTTCPVDVWVLIGVSCLRLPFSSLLTTCKRCQVLAKLPCPPCASIFLEGCPKGASRPAPSLFGV